LGSFIIFHQSISTYSLTNDVSFSQQIVVALAIAAVMAEPEADASIAYGYAPLAYAYNPYWYAPRAASYQHIATPFSVSSVSQIHKREAEPEADASVAYAYAPYAYAAYPGVAVHPGLATSFEHRSPQGLGALYRPYGFYGNYYGYY
jgi:hypothetical protein